MGFCEFGAVLVIRTRVAIAVLRESRGKDASAGSVDALVEEVASSEGELLTSMAGGSDFECQTRRRGDY